MTTFLIIIYFIFYIYLYLFHFSGKCRHWIGEKTTTSTFEHFTINITETKQYPIAPAGLPKRNKFLSRGSPN